VIGTNNGIRRRREKVDGLMFYWISWCYWIFLTFILNKQNPYRLRLSAFMLTLIILANYHFTLLGFDLYIGGLFLLFISYASTYKEKIKTITYFFICSFIVTIAYVAFHLFEISDPVWIIFNKDWMMGIFICYLSILLQKKLKDRLLMVASGTMQGEILYSYILKKFDFPYSVGTLSYLDAFALASILLVGWSILENAGFYFENNFSLSQKGKQKSS
jgi:hypothetical protein